MRITGDDKLGVEELDSFIDPESRYPVIASKGSGEPSFMSRCWAVLLRHNPNGEPASLLFEDLCRYRAEGDQSQRRGRRDVVAPSDYWTSGIFPASWIVTNFDAVNHIVSGVAKGKKFGTKRTELHPYLRVANVQRGYLDLTLVKSIEIATTDVGRYLLSDGDVLMTEGGDWDKLGRAAVWKGELEHCIHQNHIYRIRSVDKAKLLPEWIVLFANSPLGRSYFEAASKQTTNLASINMTQLRSCPLPIPPTAEQHRIVDTVGVLMAMCDRLETQLAAVQTESSRLLEAVLRRALEESGATTREPVAH